VLVAALAVDLLRGVDRRVRDGHLRHVDEVLKQQAAARAALAPVAALALAALALAAFARVTRSPGVVADAG